jgi:hypothetical protein
MAGIRRESCLVHVWQTNVIPCTTCQDWGLCLQDQMTAAAGLKSALKRADALAAAKADEAQAAVAESAAAWDRTGWLCSC